MKNLILIVLVALCLVGCISIGRGQDLEVEKLNTIINNRNKGQQEIDNILHKAEGEKIVVADQVIWCIKKGKIEFFPDPEGKDTKQITGGYYVRNKNGYFMKKITQKEGPFGSYNSEWSIVIDFEHWKMLPDRIQKEFKKWDEQ